MKTLRGKVVVAALLSLDERDQSKPLSQLVEEGLLDGDMLAVEYPDQFFLLVGWDGNATGTVEHDTHGNFEVVLTKEHDHEKPVFIWRCKSFNELWPVIEFADEWVTQTATSERRRRWGTD
jgi:hypothetical protein